MANITIPEHQLEIWAKYVQLNKNTETYEKVKEIFEGEFFDNKNNFDIYLQGSVANRTNIWADGDIDIVFQYNGTFYYNYNYTSSIYNNRSDYTQKQLREDIKSVLYKKSISYREKNKCIELHLSGEHWQNVDLVPCFQYKNHWGAGECQYYQGIKIQTLQGETIINYPKQHKVNGEEKNQQTKNFKKLVRIFKNIKKRLVDENYINETVAPSYFIECLIYNIPNNEFHGNNFSSLLCNCLNWLAENNLENLQCQNGITDLFGSGSTKWNLNDCEDFIAKTIEYVTK